MKEAVGSLYTPSKWQSEFHANTCDEVLGAGSAGPGKSVCLLMDPIFQVVVDHARMKRDPRISGAVEGSPLWQAIEQNPLRPGHSTGWCLHLRRTSNMLLQTQARARRIFSALDPGAVFSTKDNLWQFSCGYRYQFGHCKEAHSWELHMSAEYSRILWDELVQFEEEQWSQINTRLRTDDPVLEMMLGIRAMSNPLMRKTVSDNFHVSNPQWVRKYFVEPAPQGRVIIEKQEINPLGEVIPHRRMYMPATLYDNPNPKFVAQYERKLIHAKPHIRKALLYGDWYVSADSFFADEWDPAVHVCKPFKIPRDWPMFRSMDWGFKKPGSVGWYALDEEDTLYKVLELTIQRQSANEVAEKIKEIEIALKLWGPEGSRIIGPADDQIWEQRGDVGKSKAAEMADVGVNWVRADKRSRQRNAERLSERLMSHNDHTQPPGIIFFEGCRKTITTIPAMQTSHLNPEEPADGGEDHWYDETTYACAYASRGREGVAGIERDEYDYDRAEPDENRGSYGYGGH